MNNVKKIRSVKTRDLWFWLERLSRWLLAGVMLAGGVPKLVSPDTFANVIEAYGLLPEFLILPTAMLLPVIELTAAFLLIMGKKSGLWLTAMLMLLFMAVLSYAIWIGLDIDCGCFMPEDIEHAAFSNLRTALIRDVFLCLPILYCFVYVYRFPPNQFGEK